MYIKNFLSLFLSFCLICMLAACKQPSTLSNTPSDTISYNKDTIATSSKEDEFHTAYTLKDVSDERITIVDDKKIFEHLGITMSIPMEWKCMETNGEDGSTYFFHHPELSEKCQIVLSITSVEYLNERTQEEYLAYLSDIVGKDVKINSFTKEKVNGYDSAKIVSSYSSKNTNFIRIDYDNITVGVKLYDITTTFPKSEKQTFEPIFNSIVNSIEFKVD